MKYHYIAEQETYPTDLVNDLGVDAEKFPFVESPTTAVGQMSDRIKRQLNIKGRVEIVLSSYDAICSVLGSGVALPAQVCDVSGTITSVRGLTQHHMKDPLSRVFVIPWLDKSKKLWLVGGSNNMGGGLIEWGKQLLLPDTGEDAYKIMAAEASSVTPCARGLIFLPYILGERAPLWNSNARGVFFGLERRHVRKELFRAIFESAAFTSRHLIETIRSLGININELFVSGGLARIDEISQIKADVLGIPVKVPADFESTSYGAAILTFKGIDRCNNLSDAVKSMVRIEKTFDPDLQKHILYSNWFELYQSLYTNLKGLFTERGQIMSDNIYRTLCAEQEEIKENL
jgi:xylulokinase